MIENILDQSADLISASLTMSQVRYEVVDYLTPIGMETYSIFIKVRVIYIKMCIICVRINLGGEICLSHVRDSSKVFLSLFISIDVYRVL